MPGETLSPLGNFFKRQKEKKKEKKSFFLNFYSQKNNLPFSKLLNGKW